MSDVHYSFYDIPIPDNTLFMDVPEGVCSYLDDISLKLSEGEEVFQVVLSPTPFIIIRTKHS